MVLPERIELSASPLPRECSTTELRQQLTRARMPRAYEQKRWTGQAVPGYLTPMAKKDEERAKRLAEALRANLRKRKAQDRSPPDESGKAAEKIS
jgi:hypothetical protein